jgi:hypothetical protein
MVDALGLLGRIVGDHDGGPCGVSVETDMIVLMDDPLNPLPPGSLSSCIQGGFPVSAF